MSGEERYWVRVLQGIAKVAESMEPSQDSAVEAAREFREMFPAAEITVTDRQRRGASATLMIWRPGEEIWR